jgi:hypothetical protein
MDYNFSDPMNQYDNLPFDTVNHTSAICIMSNWQEQQEQNNELMAVFVTLTVLVFINVAIEVLKYLKTVRIEKNGGN